MTTVPVRERPERGVAELRRTVVTARDLVRAHQALLNHLNVYPVPDGDTGTNMARTLDAVVAAVGAAPCELAATCDAISHGSLMGARGNSGVILSQVLRGIASTLRDAPDGGAALDGDGGGSTVAAALAAASDAAYRAVVKPVEGTILTVVRESAAGATAAAAAGGRLVAVLRAARDAGRVALANTPELLAVLKDAGVVDAGGAGYVLLLDAALHVADGEPLPEPDDAAPASTGDHVGAPVGALDAGGQRYEVMFLCDLLDERVGDLTARWSTIGDSIAVVGGDGTWNCHVHTNDIGASIEAALDLDGRPHRIRVTDLFEEVAADHHGVE